MISIRPRQLEVFTAIASAGSVHEAAARLHMSQPAASMALAELERVVRVPLFDRRSRRLVLNEHGAELLPKAQETLERLEELEGRGAPSAKQLGGEIRVGTSNTIGNYLVGTLLAGFVAAYPEVSVRLVVDNTDAIVEAVLGFTVDVGCIEGPVHHPAIETLPWRSDELVICVRPGHPLTRKRRLRPDHFTGSRWILRERGSATRAQVERILAELSPGASVLELGQTEAIKQAVIAGLGIACLPRVAIDDALAAGKLAMLRTPFLSMGRRLSIALHREKYRGPVLSAFLREVRSTSRPLGAR